jgi:cellulose synthase/poly-beta-1,6-N-acetylglucosamine synthase-like glycosyltransferase
MVGHSLEYYPSLLPSKLRIKVILPTPPTTDEKYLYVRQNKIFLYSFGALSFALLTGGMVLFSLIHPAVWAFGCFIALTVFYLTISYFVGIFGREFDFDDYIFTVTKGNILRPHVDVFLPVCGEPNDLLENTWKYVQKLKYPRNRIHVWVLDDKNDIHLRGMAGNFGFGYIARNERGYLKKAGNLRYAFDRTDSELILVLDADFCPRPEMLMELTQYMKSDPKIAILQTPQYFSVDKDQTWLERGAGYVQELFYRLIQVSRDSFDAAICVGTCAVYRREALVPHGGTAAIAYSEDVHTGFNVAHDGWKVKYVPINYAKGICPDDGPSYFMQQYRWCMGSTTLCTNREFWNSRLTFMQKLCYASGFLYYISTALSIFIAPLPGVVVVWFFPEHIFWYNWVFVIPSFIYGTLYMALWGKQKFGLYALKARLISHYAHFFAIKDKIFGNILEWVPTGSGQSKKQVVYNHFKNVCFWWSTLIALTVAVGFFIRAEFIEAYHFIPLLFFTFFHYWVATFCVSD